jgi:hypothetical protein
VPIYRGQTSRGQADKLQFAFVANRRLGDKVRASLEELVDGAEAFTHPTEAATLRDYLGFGENRKEELAFCRRLLVDDGSPGLAEMEQLVRDELHQYLPGGTGTEMIQLVEAVARCATSLADRQTLERSDVLLAGPCTVDCAWYVRSATSLGVFVASSLRIPAAPWSTCSPTYLDLCRRRAATEGGPPPVVANWPHSRHGPTADEFASDAAEVVRPDGVVELLDAARRGEQLLGGYPQPHAPPRQLLPSPISIPKHGAGFSIPREGMRTSAVELIGEASTPVKPRSIPPPTTRRRRRSDLVDRRGTAQ